METIINCSYLDIKKEIEETRLGTLYKRNNLGGNEAIEFIWYGPGFSITGPFLKDGSQINTPITGQQKLFWKVEGNFPTELQAFKVGQETPTIEEVRMLQQRAGIKRG